MEIKTDKHAIYITMPANRLPQPAKKSGIYPAFKLDYDVYYFFDITHHHTILSSQHGLFEDVKRCEINDGKRGNRNHSPGFFFTIDSEGKHSRCGVMLNTYQYMQTLTAKPNDYYMYVYLSARTNEDSHYMKDLKQDFKYIISKKSQIAMKLTDSCSECGDIYKLTCGARFWRQDTPLGIKVCTCRYDLRGKRCSVCRYNVFEWTRCNDCNEPFELFGKCQNCSTVVIPCQDCGRGHYTCCTYCRDKKYTCEHCKFDRYMKNLLE